MEEIYIIDGIETTLAQMQAYAAESKMELTDYIAATGAVKKEAEEEVEKQEATAVDAAEVVAEDVAAEESMDSTSDDVSLDSPYLSSGNVGKFLGYRNSFNPTSSLEELAATSVAEEEEEGIFNPSVTQYEDAGQITLTGDESWNEKGYITGEDVVKNYARPFKEITEEQKRLEEEAIALEKRRKKLERQERIANQDPMAGAKSFWMNTPKQQENEDERIAYEKAQAEYDAELEAITKEESNRILYKSKEAYNEEIAANPLLNSKLTVDEQVAAYKNDLDAIRDLNTTDAEKSRLMLQLPVPRLVNIKYDSENQTTKVIPKPEIVNTVKASLGVIKNEMSSKIVETKIVNAVANLMDNNDIVKLINKTISAKYVSRLEAEQKRIDNLPISNLEKSELIAEFARREKFLEDKELASNKNLIDFREDYTLIASDAAAKSNKQWKRANDVILGGIDFARNKVSGVPIVAGAVDFATSMIEGVHKAVGINAPITANQITISSSQLGAERTAGEIAMAKRLNPKDIINVEVSGFYGEEVIGDIKSVDTPNGEKGFDVLDERGKSTNTADYRGKTKKMTVAEYLKYKESQAAGYKKDIITDIEDIEGYDKYAEIFDQVDWDEGMTFKNAGMAVGETLPQMGVTMAGAVTGNPVLIALGTATMFAQEYGSMYYETLLTGLREDLKREPTTEEIYQALEEGKYADQSEAAAFAAISTSLEQTGNLVGVSKAFKALGVTEKTGLKSLFRGEIKGFIKNTGKTALVAGESGFVEGLTEGMQQGVSQLGTGYQLGGLKGLYDYVNTDEIIDATISGTTVGVLIPSSKSFYRQTKVETRAALTKVAVGLDISGLGENLKKADKAFNNAVAGVDRKVEFGEITEEQGREEKEAISDVRNSTLKMPKEFYSFSESQRSAYLDAMIRKQELVRKIKNLDDNFTEKDNAELDQVNEYLRGLIARATGTETKSYEVSDAMKPTEIVEEGSKEALEGEIAATNLELSAMEQVEKSRKELETVSRIASEVGDTDFKGEEGIGEGNAVEVFDTAEELTNSYKTYAENQKAKLQNYVDAIEKAVPGEKSKTMESALQKLKNEIAQLDNDIANVGRSDGFITPTGQIIINREVAAKTGAVSASSHELLHKILKSEFSDKSRAVEIADQFKKTLSRKELRIVQKRIDDNYRYQRDEDGRIMYDEVGAIENDYKDYAEEYLTSFSDAIAKKEIKWSDNLGMRLWEMKEFLLSGFKRKGFPNIKFQNGRDVYNFIKDYQKNIKKDKISDRARAMADAGKGITTDTKTSKTANTEIKQIGEQINSIAANANTAADVQTLLYNDLFAEDAPPKTSNLVNNIIKAQLRKNGVDVDKADATVYDQPLYGKNGIMQEIKSHFIERSLMRFDPAVNDNVGGFVVSELVNYRIGDITNKYKPQQGTISIDKPTSTGKAFDIEDKSAQDNVVKQAETRKAKVTPRSKIKKAVPELITQQVEEDIEVAALEILEGVRPDPNSKEYRPFITQVLEAKLTPKMKKAFGTAKGYEFLIKKLAPKMKEIMPIQYFVKLESQVKPEDRVFTNPPVDLGTNAEIDAAMDKGTVYVENNAQGVNEYTFKDFNNQDLIDFILAPPVSPTTGKKSGLRGTRKTSTAASTAIEVGRDMVVSLAEGRVSPAERALLAKKLQRDPGIKFSNTAQKEEYKSHIKKFADNLVDQNLGYNKKAIERALYKTYINENTSDVWGRTLEEKEISLSELARDLVNPIKKLTKPKGKTSLKTLKAFPDIGEFTVEELTQKELATNLIKALDLDIKNFGSAFEDPANVTFQRQLEADYINSLVESKGKEEAVRIALTILKGHNATASKIGASNLGVLEPGGQRYQVFEGMEDYVNSVINTIPKVRVKTGKTKDGKTTIKSITIDGKPIDKYPSRQAQKSKSKKHFQETFEKRKEESDEVWELLLDYIDFMKANGNNLSFGMTMMSLKSSMDSMLKAAALAKYYYVGPDMKASELRYEHMIPTEYVALKLTQHFLGKKIDLKALKDKYNVAVIPKIMDDNINVQLQAVMPSYWNETMSETERYFSELTLGYPNMYALEVIGGENKGDIIGEDFLKLNDAKLKAKVKVNIPIIDDAKVMNTKNSYSMSSEDVLNKAASLDESLRNARNPKAPVKKIRVFDFDDTLARTKSKVYYTRPNTTGKPSPKRKAIFMIGGPGSGKTNIGKGLQLGREGFKVVNQDIFVESEKAKQGLPESEKGYTPEQKSARARIGAAGIKAAKNKLKKYTEAGEGMVIDGTGASYNATMKKVKDLENQGYEVHMVYAQTSPEAAKERNRNRPERRLPTWIVDKTQKSVEKNVEQYKKDFGDRFMEIDTETIEYGKPLPKEFVDQVKAKVYENEVGTLNAEQFAKQGDLILEEGGEFNFSDFNRVVDGKPGPLLDIAKKIQESRGTEDLFVLTARASESSLAIKKFLKSVGLDIPLKNISGLGDSSPFAKSNWIVDKAAEGYNDFYFTDDHMSNVKAVRDALEVLDVKSKTQQAKIQFSMSLSDQFNTIIEESKGIDRFKVYSDVKAKLTGARKGKFKFFIPPSAEDFQGLLYATLGKGKQGMEHMQFYDKALLKPYAQAMENLATDRINLMNDFKALKKELNVPKDLREKTKSGFTNEQAVRVYLWNVTGQEVPGISKRDFKELTDIVDNNPQLKVFADQILTLTKGDGYSTPKTEWQVGTITTDLMELLNTTKRAKYLETWQANVDEIFSKDNMNKLEAALGPKYVEALRNSLARMKAGRNRIQGGNRLSNQVLDYINQSTGVTMFLNMRSALLQTISSANFINWSFNSPYHAGKAFANQAQYWKDFTMLMNSDYLKDRRNGLKLNINENEIANAAKTSKNKAKAVLNYILEKGYTPTKFADSFAIASGGALFYRNRVNDLIKNEGLTKAEAERQAMLEFKEKSEISQQSSDPSKISQQQSSDMGRIILQYVNTPMQYARIQKRDIQDMINRRPMPGKTLAQSNRTRVARITYYAFIQNMIFNALQQGVFALGFGDDDEELSESDKEKLFNGANGMLDSWLRGLGFAGVTVQVLKNLGIDIYDRSQRSRTEYSDAWIKLLEFSPAIKSKLSKFRGAAYPFDSKKRRKEVFDKGFSLDNPAYESAAKVISATTNIPVDRLFNKINNIKAALDEDTETWQSVAMIMGWPEWQLREEESKDSKSKTSKSKRKPKLPTLKKPKLPKLKLK
jgi:predicted kinase